MVRQVVGRKNLQLCRLVGRRGGVRRSSHVLWLALAITIGWALAAHANHPNPMRADALIQLPRAENVSYDVYKGRERLTYSLAEDYPAEKSLDQIRSRLKAQGWTPLDDNYFMPGVTTSHVTGWETFEDTDIDNDVRVIVHAWSADWTNAEGDIVLYGLKYSYPKDGQPNLSHLEVFAVYFPRLVAESIRRSPNGILSD